MSDNKLTILDLYKNLKESRTPGRIGFLLDSEGNWYQTKVDFVQDGVLGFCTCGNPEDNLSLIKDGLEIIAERDWQARKHLIGMYFDDSALFNFFLYWADKEELTDHGGNISGSWLSETGEELLEVLKYMRDEGEI